MKLAESTIRRKGSSKALIDTGFLINAITQKIMGDRAFEVFCAVPSQGW